MSVIDALTPKILKDARDAKQEKERTAADLRDAVRKAREAIDAAVAKKEAEARTAHVGQGG